jgi:hypothetical protein
MTTAEILEELRLACPKCLLADGYEDAIVGVVEGCARPVLVVYEETRGLARSQSDRVTP